MTSLTRKVKRSVHDPRRGDLVVTMAEEGIYIRYKGKRTTYGPIGYGLILLQGEKALANQILKEKKERREMRRIARR